MTLYCDLLNCDLMCHFKFTLGINKYYKSSVLVIFFSNLKNQTCVTSMGFCHSACGA